MTNVKVQDGDTRDQGLHCESYLWLGLGNKNTSVKVRKGRFWFRMNVNKQDVSLASSHYELFLYQTRPGFFPNLNQVLPLPKHSDAEVTTSGYCIARTDILSEKNEWSMFSENISAHFHKLICFLGDRVCVSHLLSSRCEFSSCLTEIKTAVKLLTCTSTRAIKPWCGILNESSRSPRNVLCLHHSSRFLSYRWGQTCTCMYSLLLSSLGVHPLSW